jgi:hypothetical protein
VNEIPMRWKWSFPVMVPLTIGAILFSLLVVIGGGWQLYCIMSGKESGEMYRVMQKAEVNLFSQLLIFIPLGLTNLLWAIFGICWLWRWKTNLPTSSPPPREGLTSPHRSC